MWQFSTLTPAFLVPRNLGKNQLKMALKDNIKTATDSLKNHWKIVAAVSGGAVVVSIGYLYFKGRRGSKSLKADTAAQMTDIERDDDSFVTSSQENNISGEELKLNEKLQKSDVKSDKPEEDADMSKERREEMALGLKNRGNKYFAAKKYERAIELYTEALSYYPEIERNCSVFFSNRAACWAGLENYEKVLEDCNSAIKADPIYKKAIGRRATALEKLSRYQESLRDFTIACFLDEFKTQALVESADRVLKKLVSDLSKNFDSEENRSDLPSLSFITAYLSSFRYEYVDDAVNDSEEQLNSGDKMFLQSIKAFKQKEWDLSFKLIEKSVELGLEKFAAEGLNLRGTFFFLMGRADEAIADYNKSLESNDKIVNTYIKIASALIEKSIEESMPEALKLLDKAVDINAKDPDIYYHRAQIHFLVQDYTKALSDYDKTIELDDSFVFAKIQKAVVEYRLGNFKKSVKLFESAKKHFPDNADVLYYYGEVLLDHQDIEGSLQAFEKAVKVDPSRPLPYLNQAIVYAHVKGDVEQGINFTKKAINADKKCDLAYMHLAQMQMAQGNVDAAIVNYEKALSLSRTKMDVENAMMGIEASKAQKAAVSYVSQLRSKSP